MGADPVVAASENSAREIRIATLAESLYLVNLLLAPVIGFALLVWLWWREQGGRSDLTRCHLGQTVRVSIWGAVLLVLSLGAILAFGGLSAAWTWVAVIIYFTCVHTTLVLLGMVGLAHAMAGRVWFYPWIGGQHET